MKAFYLGSNLHDSVLSTIKKSGDSVLIYEDDDIVAVNEHDDLSTAKNHINSNKTDILELSAQDRAVNIGFNNLPYNEKLFDNVDIDLREKIQSMVINDIRLFLLRTRFTRVDYKGMLKGVCDYTRIIDHAIAFNTKYKPTLVFSSYTPHTESSWIFLRTQAAMGVRIIRIISTPLPWLYAPVYGLENDYHDIEFKLNNSYQADKVKIYLDRLRGDYDKALPYYEKSISKDIISGFQSMVKSLTIKNIFKNIEKKLVYKEFQLKSENFDCNGKYAVYFLHYQPEMNTVPEAGIYGDQYNAILKLRKCLPDDVKLVIKEHPSTFSKRCDRRWRPSGFYERITSFENTLLCSIDTQTFDLIDNSIFVSSIAGICLTEALARGITAVTFFSPRFIGFSDEIVIDATKLSGNDLMSKFDKLCSNVKKKEFESKLISSFKNLTARCYDGSYDDVYLPETSVQSHSMAKNATCKAVEDIIENKLY